MRTLRIIQTASGGKNVAFRSLSEIERVLEDIRTGLVSDDQTMNIIELSVVEIVIDKGHKPAKKPSANNPHVVLLSAPDVKTIEKNFLLVDDLDQKIKALDSIAAQLAYQFQGEKNHATVLRETRALRKDVEDRIKKAYAAINKIAKGNVDSGFKQYCDDIAEALFEKLDGQYDRSTQRLFVDTEMGLKTLRFTHYIRFENLEDDNGHTYKEYNVALTHIIGATVDTFSVNTMPVFRVPGRFNSGVVAENVDHAVDVIDNMLRSEGFKSIISGNDIPLGKRDVPEGKFSHLASKLSVGDDAIEFVVRKDVPFKRAVDDLYVLVKGLVDGKVKGQEVRYTTEGQRVRFFLNSSKAWKLNRTQLRLLQKDLGLNDDDVKKIMQEVL